MSLRVENVAFSYPNHPIVRDISFDLPSGDFLSLLGPNGSGKSTLLRLLDRILLPAAGSIFLNNRSLSEYSRKDLARKIAFVPQDGLPVFPFTVLEVILMGRSPHIGQFGFESQHDLDIAYAMMKLTDVEHLASKPVTALSGGERQRVIIARALTQEPDILLLDEPNAHLDISHQLEIFELLRHLHQEKGLTVLSVSHDLNLSAVFSSRIMLLAPPLELPSGAYSTASTIVALGTPQEVLNETIVQRVFGTPVLIDQHPLLHSVRVSLLPSREKVSSLFGK